MESMCAIPVAAAETVPGSGREAAHCLGASYVGACQCQFEVWAPYAKRVELCITAPKAYDLEMAPAEGGYFRAVLESVEPGTRYLYRLDGGKLRPDPASRYQPSGVHEPSQVPAQQELRSGSSWKGLALEDYVVYELHVGTFTPEGTFAAIIPRIDHLLSLGVTAIELMPVAQFPGERNWGYDGVYPFAVQNSYGGPEGLRRLVEACHQRGMAVVLDVVYNHMGPEGNYLSDFGPYFTDAYKTPWGRAVNFDGADSDGVVSFFLQSALYWLDEFEIDALRLDAIHGIVDRNARPFLELLATGVDQLARRQGRKIWLIAESDLNDARYVLPRERNGYGLHAQWNDDFHHAAHVLLTGEQSGYYADFGKLEQMARAMSEGYVYQGEYSEFRQRRHGNRSTELDGRQFMVCVQNHDQVGNRRLGERLGQLASFESLKLAAGLLLLSPNLPLIFMGDEYGETAPFLYFTSHGDQDLVAAVRKGRKEEFSAFGWEEEPPDPQDVATFQASKLDFNLANKAPHSQLLALYRELLRVRREAPALRELNNKNLATRIFESERILLMRRWNAADEATIVFHFGETEAQVSLPAGGGRFEKWLDSADRKWGGPGSPSSGKRDAEGETTVRVAPKSFCLYRRIATGDTHS